MIVKLLLDFVFGYLASRFGPSVPTSALDIVKPILGDLIDGDTRLTPETRLEIQARLDTALRSINSEGGV